MRICFVTTVQPIVGGVGTWVNMLTNKLTQKGHFCKIIGVIGSSGREFTTIQPRLGMFLSGILNSDILFFLAYKASGWLLYGRVLAEARKHKIDVVNAQDVNALNAAYSICRRQGIRLVLTVHGSFYNGGTASRTIPETRWLGRYLIMQEQKAYRQADHIITVSSGGYEYAASIAAKEKVSLLRNFVDKDVFYPFEAKERLNARVRQKYRNDDYIVFFAGRLTRAKGLEYIVKGVRDLTENIPIKLVIAGSGPFLQSILGWIDEYDLKERVVLTGALPKEELLNLYNAADVFIMAPVQGEGSTEGTPMAMLEAMACGLPVLSTDAGGIKDVLVSEYNGFFIKERDGGSIADALLKLWHDKPLRRKLGENSLKLINMHYSIDQVLHEILDIYKKHEA